VPRASQPVSLDQSGAKNGRSGLGQTSDAQLQEEIGELIECIRHFHAQNNKRSDHQIKAEMHEVLNQKLTCGLPVDERPQNRTQYSGDDWRCFELRWIRRQRLSIISCLVVAD
jgi:hypothetical protein